MIPVNHWLQDRLGGVFNRFHSAAIAVLAYAQTFSGKGVLPFPANSFSHQVGACMYVIKSQVLTDPVRPHMFSCQLSFRTEQAFRLIHPTSLQPPSGLLVTSLSIEITSHSIIKTVII